MKSFPSFSFSAAALKISILDLLFPYRCVGCGSEGQLLCEKCLLEQERLLPPLCGKCGTRSTATMCQRCQSQSDAFDGVRSAFTYQGAIREAIIQFKYHGITDLAQVLGFEMAHRLVETGVSCDILLPVPLHTKRLKERGYNQAALLAKTVAATVGLPIEEGILTRVRATPSQAKSSGIEERRRQVQDAFRCAYPDVVAGKNIVVVDDVCTTGATLDACARALKGAGAATVWGLTLAREL